MVTGLLGRKLGMTQIFDEVGNKVAVTVIQAGPCPIVQVKSMERDGYVAVQLGFLAQRAKLVNRPRKGHFDAASVEPTRLLREFPLPEDAASEDFQPGQVVDVNLFSRGDRVSVSGTSKGKGFQGGIKRHGWSGGKASHGSMFHRAPGSIGASAYPSRVVPGHPLPGQMGNVRKTVRNLKVVAVVPDENLLLLQGSIPGSNNGLVEIHLTAKAEGAATGAEAGE